MTARKRKNAADVPAAADEKLEAGELRLQNIAIHLLEPTSRNALLASSFGAHAFPAGSATEDLPRSKHYRAAMVEQVAKTTAGNLAIASEILTSQAISLDALFTDLARRAGLNMRDYPEAAERYMRLAFKAQSNCRTTLEALAKLHQPREQTVRHVHVNEGGQAIVADHFHSHAGGPQNARIDVQPQALESPPAPLRSPLRREDQERDGMPVSGDA